MAAHTALPSPDTLAKAATLKVFDDAGKEVTFGSLIEDKKTILVFIRTLFFTKRVPAFAVNSRMPLLTAIVGHFFCGVRPSAACQSTMLLTLRSTVLFS